MKKRNITLGVFLASAAMVLIGTSANADILEEDPSIENPALDCVLTGGGWACGPGQGETPAEEEPVLEEEQLGYKVIEEVAETFDCETGWTYTTTTYDAAYVTGEPDWEIIPREDWTWIGERIETFPADHDTLVARGCIEEPAPAVETDVPPAETPVALDTTPANELAETGIPLLPLALLGAGAIAGGLALRKVRK